MTSGKDAFCGGADLTMLETLSRTFAELAEIARRRGGEPRGCSTRAANCR